MRSIILVLLASLPVIVLAQSNYYEGYVLKNNGDTLRGFINYREWSYSPASIEFRLNKKEGQVLNFGPKDIKGFEVTGFENYISFIGLVSVNKNIFPDIPTTLDTTRQAAAIFLKLSTTGSHIALYYNNEVSKNRFFIAEKDEMPEELKYYEYYGASRSSEEVKNVFRGQLLLYVYKYNNGDKTLLTNIDGVKFEEIDLKNIVDKINNGGLNTKDAGLRHENKKSSSRWFGGVGINTITNTYSYSGITSTTVNGNQFAISPIYASQQSNAVVPKFDAGVDLFINPEIQQFVFRAELSYASQNSQFHQPATANFSDINLSYIVSSLMVMPQFLYNFYNQPNIKIFIGAGAGINFIHYSANKNSTASDANTFGTGSGPLIQVQAGIAVAKRIEFSLALMSYTTTAGYSAVTVTNHVTKNFGVNVFLN